MISFAFFEVQSLSCAKTQVKFSEKELEKFEYKIIKDEGGFGMSIGVDSELSIEQIKKTLVKAANEHESDRARDYMSSEYLIIQAYLIKGDKQSEVWAGKIRRYVPPRNNTALEKEEEDVFWFNLDKARKSIK
jgi:hypothetical protein